MFRFLLVFIVRLSFFIACAQISFTITIYFSWGFLFLNQEKSRIKNEGKRDEQEK